MPRSEAASRPPVRLPTRLFSLLDHHRFTFQAGSDALAWAVALALGVLLRYDFSLDILSDVSAWAAIVPLAVLTQIVTGLVAGLYLARWSFGSFEEVAALVRGVTLSTVILYILNLWVGDPQIVPRGAVVAGGVIALFLMAGTRYGWRLALESRNRPSGAAKLIVFGAGQGCEQVVTAMLRDPSSPYLPVAILDDDPAKLNLRVRGVKVVGTRAHLERVARDHGAATMLVAVPSARASLIAELAALGERAGLAVKVLPSVTELLGVSPRVEDIRDVTEADLLGRHEVRVDLESISGYIAGRKVLVTGAGGSIGSELCRQIRLIGPASLVMVDRDEAGLHGVQLSIEGHGLLDSPDIVLGDVRDRAMLERLMGEHRPDVVFHAAAVKHLPLLERHPDEALRTNVLGTLALLRVCADAGVTRFINVSTDKAADPVNVLGYSKRIAERLTAYEAEEAAAGVYLSVRFGNVLGSSGSMLETFQHQVESGGPLTVTHPDAERYFMTVEEAVQLMIQAGAIGQSGEALVLDMGERVRIDEVARRLSRQVDPPVEIVYTGLRRGEKLHESLFGEGEHDRRPSHPLVAHVEVPPLHPDQVRDLDPAWPHDRLVSALREACFAPVPASRLAERG